MKTLLESAVSITTSSNYTTNSIDSIVKSCLNCHDQHLHFESEPYPLRGINYLIFPATTNFLPQELATFRCHNCGTTAFYRMVLLLNILSDFLLSMRHIKLLLLLVQLDYVGVTVILLAPQTLCSLLTAVRYPISLIATRLRMDICAKTIAFEEAVSTSTVNRLLDSTRCEFQDNFNFLPLHLCFDEFRGTHNTYHFICLDADNHIIQTILPNRLNRLFSITSCGFLLLWEA